MVLTNGINKIASAALMLLLPVVVQAKEKLTANSVNSFIKNVGQITDENRHSRTDIDFKIGGSGISVFVSNEGLQYQWYKIKPAVKPVKKDTLGELLQKYERSVDDTVELCAMWMKLIGANTSVVPEVEEAQPYYENYYLSYCWGKKANSYNKIIYRNIYPNIDWVLYVDKNNAEGFKYDFIVHTGGKVSDIQMRYEAASTLSLDNGAVSIALRFGAIKEDRPYTYDINTGSAIESNYILADSIVRFNCSRTDNVVIDPRLNWCSYFSNPGESIGTAAAADTFGNAYICGKTSQYINIASFNAYWPFHKGGKYDGFIAQFNSRGNYVNWATYYGGENDDEIAAAVTDHAGYLYLTGTTYSYTGVTGGGAQQDSNGAAIFRNGGVDNDGFLAKFNQYGGFEWGTYIGGHGAEQATSLICDASNNIYVGGTTTGNDSLATAGVFQTTGNGAGCGFLASYSAITGKRNWGTFFNGQVYSVAYANNKRVYITGFTKYYVDVATPGAYQQSFGGHPTINGFVVSFDATNGKRKWGTYYPKYFMGAVCDSLYNVYVGDQSYHFCKFDSSGNLKWQHDLDTATPMALTPNNNILSGALGGRVTKHSWDGDRLWINLYGTNYVNSVCYGSAAGWGKIYMVSTTVSPGLATPGSFQDRKSDTLPIGFIVQLQADTNVYIRFPYIDTLLCIGGPLNLKYGVTNPFRPGNVFTVQLSNTSGSFASPVNIGNVAYNDRGEIACTIPLSITPGTGYRIRIVSSLPADTFYCYDRTIRISEYYYPQPFAPQPICANLFVTLFDSSHISPPLGVKYTWKSPNPNRPPGQLPTYYINPLVLADSGYHVLIADNYGCVRKDSVHVHITVAPPEPTITGDTSLCIGDTLMLTASSPVPGVVFSWFDPANNWRGDSVTIKTPNVSFSDSGKYRIAAVLNGCQSDPQYGQVITVHPLPQPTATNTGPVCAGEELKLNATDTITNVTYTWSSSNGSFSHNKKDTTIKNTSTALSSQYTVKTRTIHGCENTAVTNVTVKPLPNDPDTRSNSPVCTRTALQLLSTATNAATYSWTGPNGFTSAQQSPVLPNSTPGMQGRYILVVDLDGCKKADTTEVQIDQSPDTPQLSSNSPLQTGKTLELKIGNKQSGVNYTWSGPNFSSNEAEPKLPNVIPANSGVYTATAISGKCIVQDTIHIVVKDETGKDPKAPVVIFPNPNNGSFRITGETQTAGDVELGVYASDGKRVYKATITPQNNKIEADVNIGGVSAGVYRLKIRIDGKATGLSFTIKP